MAKIVELKTCKFEYSEKEHFSFDQDSVGTGGCYFSLPQKQPFTNVTIMDKIYETSSSFHVK